MGDLLNTRENIEKNEKLILAPFAAHSVDTLGRQHKEEEHPYRNFKSSRKNN